MSMSMTNTERVIMQSNAYIANINKLLKEVKSNIFADYICSNNKGIIIMANKIVTSFNLNIIKKYIKELNNVDINDIISPKLPQSKLHFKILDILYFVKDTNYYDLRLRVKVKSKILDWIIIRGLDEVPSAMYLPFILY